MEKFSWAEERETGDKIEAEWAENTSRKLQESLSAYRGLSCEFDWVLVCHCAVLWELREVYRFNAPTAIADQCLSRWISARHDWDLP